MNKALILVVGFFILLSAFIKESFSESRMKPFKWMEASWTMKVKNGSIMETWTSINDSAMGGESILVRSTGGVQVQERVRLICRGKEYFYCPTAEGQNNNQEVKFRITSYNDTSFIAENPEHDFPKRISYTLVNKDSIHAFVDAGPSAPGKKSDFYYSRYKN